MGFYIQTCVCALGYLKTFFCLFTQLYAEVIVCFMLQDIGSTNILELCASLMTSCNLVSIEIIPALLPSVIAKLSHPK